MLISWSNFYPVLYTCCGSALHIHEMSFCNIKKKKKPILYVNTTQEIKVATVVLEENTEHSYKMLVIVLLTKQMVLLRNMDFITIWLEHNVLQKNKEWNQFFQENVNQVFEEHKILWVLSRLYLIFWALRLSQKYMWVKRKFCQNQLFLGLYETVLRQRMMGYEFC